ncbi:MAG: hypothetical protein ACP5E4_02840, partial [Candidatus Aenigmatarchaeota archaeon]
SESKDAGSGVLGSISGMFSVPNFEISAYNAIAGLLVAAIIVVVVLIVRKKRGMQVQPYARPNYNFRGAGMPRNHVMASMSTIKSQIRGKKE